MGNNGEKLTSRWVKIGDMPDSFSPEFVFKRSSVVIARSRRRISRIEVNGNSRCQKAAEKERERKKTKIDSEGMGSLLLWLEPFGRITNNQRRQSRDKTGERERGEWKKERENLLFPSDREKGGSTCPACLMMRMSVLFSFSSSLSDCGTLLLLSVSCFCSLSSSSSSTSSLSSSSSFPSPSRAEMTSSTTATTTARGERGIWKGRKIEYGWGMVTSSREPRGRAMAQSCERRLMSSSRSLKNESANDATRAMSTHRWGRENDQLTEQMALGSRSD